MDSTYSDSSIINKVMAKEREANDLVLETQKNADQIMYKTLLDQKNIYKEKLSNALEHFEKDYIQKKITLDQKFNEEIQTFQSFLEHMSYNSKLLRRKARQLLKLDQ